MAKEISEKDIERAINKVVNRAIEDIKNQVVSEIDSRFAVLIGKSVDAFYDDYSPKKYQRTDGFRNGAKQGYRIERNGDYVEVAAIPDFVPDHPGWNPKNPQPYKGEEIWKDAYIYGIHGTQDVAIMKEPPTVLVKKDFQKMLDEACDSAVNNYLAAL